MRFFFRKFEEARASIGDKEDVIEEQLGVCQHNYHECPLVVLLYLCIVLQFIATFESEIQRLLQKEISLEENIVHGVEEIERIKDRW